jgi:hypothetical protein
MKRQENENDRKAFPNNTEIWHRAKRRKIIAIRRLFVAFSLLKIDGEARKSSADRNKPTTNERNKFVSAPKSGMQTVLLNSIFT